MAYQLDVGLVAGNYFDYADDDVAVQREYEIMEGLGIQYTDPCFPPDARSLYFDPFHPPKGASPGTSFIWCRISRGEVLKCDAPIFCKRDSQSSQIIQGALGNAYLINALRLLAAVQNEGKQIMRLLVSDKYAAAGMYTFKFFKAGRWRYVHIDDLIPCRQSGRVNFCRNVDPNETFAMLLEKAYAKLHGCYEAIVHGLTEKVLGDLTPGGHTRCHRNERANLDNVCDKAWEFVEKGLAGGHSLGCSKCLPDPYCEKLSDRQGITVGVMYQIMDAMTVTNAATAEMDTLTVGMVCVRNLQADEGRFIGRWSYGHATWQQYKDIGMKLRHRTRELMFKRGLGLDPNLRDQETGDLVNFVEDDHKTHKLFKEEEKIVKLVSERDGLEIDYIGRTRYPPPQPTERDLYWIQIEDFVDVFNRAYSLYDPSIPPPGSIPGTWKPGNKRFISKWIPGDSFCGSGGPPILLRLPKAIVPPNPADPEIDDTLEAFRQAEEDGEREVQRGTESGGGVGGGDGLGAGAGAEAGAGAGAGGGAGAGLDTVEAAGQHVGVTGSAAPSRRGSASNVDAGATPSDESKQDGGAQPNTDGEAADPTATVDSANLVTGAETTGTATTAAGIKSKQTEYIPIVVAATPVAATYDDEDEVGEEEAEEEAEEWSPIQINEDFTDNPMYPFSVTEPTQICITLYQADRRWTLGRLGEDPRSVVATAFASRAERLAACMRYSQAVGFLVVRMFGAKMRLTEYKLRKISGGSDDISYSNAASATVQLRPGRYAIIPFTDKVVASAQEYILYCSFCATQVEFEVSDLMIEKPQDHDLSDDDSGVGDADQEEEEREREDEEEAEGIDRSPEAFAEREKARHSRRLAKLKERFESLEVKPPPLATLFDWEFIEDSENMATISVFDEVSSFVRAVGVWAEGCVWCALALLCFFLTVHFSISLS